MAQLLATPVAALPGIGPRRAVALEAAFGAEARLADLLVTLPSRIDRLEALAPLDDLPSEAVVIAFTPTPPWRDWGRFGAVLDGKVDARPIRLRWFRRPPQSLARRLAAPGPHLLLAKLDADECGRWRADHPKPIRAVELGQRRVRYSGLDGRLARTLGELVRTVVARWPDEGTCAALPTTAGALAILHGVAEGDAEAARQRLAIEEWRAFRLEHAAARAALGRTTRPIRAGGRLADALIRALPFAPTPSQVAAHAAIRADVGRGERMRRLVNGDVGSGKTLVAALAAADVIEAGRQVALMAPSEALARQHADTLDRWLRPLGVEVALLVGTVPKAGRSNLHQALQDGRIHLLVGTHALFEAPVPFRDLGLLVIDEQHRFGVRQRLALAAKGTDAHVLSLSATPIPRSLAMALRGDLEVSHLEARPGTGGNVVTRAVPNRRVDQVVERLLGAIDRGERAFWVTASIDGTGHDAGALARFEALRTLRPKAVGLVHGRMQAAQRDAALTAFRTGQTSLLVATTIVEVGIDVPDASIIVIEAAERFGLAQLHQLRGRVGRAGQPASCLLLHTTPLAPGQHRRLDLLRRCHDGLKLAEADLAWRGEGDRLGWRQAGVAAFRFVDWGKDEARLRALTLDDPTPGGCGRFDPRWLFRPQSTVAGGLVAG
ncbi:MAG: DEAD/DEAH box helicase [Geminicoccaceae bacterium]|nr:MAG: DEAD/DEAH box helicase [Geminicoccaceae bacterium]